MPCASVPVYAHTHVRIDGIAVLRGVLYGEKTGTLEHTLKTKDFMLEHRLKTGTRTGTQARACGWTGSNG
jgi:hypothetical protein